MRGNGIIWRALEAARRSNLAEAGAAPPIPGGSGTARRALLAAMAGGAAAALLPRTALAAPGERIAILGGGIAGLAALHHLAEAGADVRLYEARSRLGGRMHSRRIGGTLFESGGQLVNSDHADLRGLAERFGIALVDRKAEPHRTLVLADGALVDEARLAEGLRAIAARIDADAALLDGDYARHAPRFDRLSIAGYLDRHRDLIPQPWVRRLLEGTSRTEYGAEPDQASALELLFNLPVVDGRRVEVLGGSDERYVIDGGSSALVEAIAARHADRIERGRRAIALASADRGVRIRFQDGSAVAADRVIVAVPASLARAIDYGLPLPAAWRAFLAEMRLGRNEKLQAATRARPWLETMGMGGEAWFTDREAPCALAWDGGVHRGGEVEKVWTWFMGGAQVAADPDRPHPRELDARTRAIVPDLALGDDVDRTDWTHDPHSRGAYSNFPPGQLTRFGHLLWVDSEDPEERQVAGAGRILFAGEHLSDAYPGYMNGAAQTGRLAAEAIVGRRLLARAA